MQFQGQVAYASVKTTEQRRMEQQTPKQHQNQALTAHNRQRKQSIARSACKVARISSGIGAAPRKSSLKHLLKRAIVFRMTKRLIAINESQIKPTMTHQHTQNVSQPSIIITSLLKLIRLSLHLRLGAQKRLAIRKKHNSNIGEIALGTCVIDFAMQGYVY